MKTDPLAEYIEELAAEEKKQGGHQEDDSVGFDTNGHQPSSHRSSQVVAAVINIEEDVPTPEKLTKVPSHNTTSQSIKRTRWPAKNEPVDTSVTVTTRRKRLANAPAITKSTLGQRRTTSTYKSKS